MILTRASELVDSMVDSGLQCQMCGVDLTVAEIERFAGSGCIDLDNRERELPGLVSVYRDGDTWVLSPGAYLVRFNEIVSVPRDCAAIARPRSTLLRCGATIETALWDPGYRGRSQSMLVVYNPAGIRIKKNARIMQLIFIRLDRDADRLYDGVYQGEGTG